MSHPLGRLALLHPFPSALNALLVAVLASVAGASSVTAVTLAVAMAGFQVAIGALRWREHQPERVMDDGFDDFQAFTVGLPLLSGSRR